MYMKNLREMFDLSEDDSAVRVLMESVWRNIQMIRDIFLYFTGKDCPTKFQFWYIVAF